METVDAPSIVTGVLTGLTSDLGTIIPAALAVAAILLTVSVGWRTAKKFVK